MISVVIPTLNEEGIVGRCIGAVNAEGASCEIIIADGGSSDGTIEEAKGFRNIRIVRSGGGRGRQLNAGAATAQGEILLFLHADTVLEDGWSGAVLSAFNEDGVVGGAFTFRIDSPGLRFRLTEWWVRLRCSLFHLPYGDQGIFIRKDVFEKLKGYRDFPVMEDVDMVERMKGLGRMKILDKQAFTDARKWMREGWVRTSLRNQLVMLMYRLGADPRSLARIYYRGA